MGQDRRSPQARQLCLRGRDSECDALARLLELPRGVDKDLAAVVFAFGMPDAHGHDQLTAERARSLLQGPELAAGSMRPKVDVCAGFAGSGGIAIIAALEQASEPIRGCAGTRVVPSRLPVAAAAT